MRARYTKPYVDALFSVAGGAAAVDALLPRLDTFERTLRGSDELRAVLRNPGVERERKIAIFGAIAKKDGLDGLGLRLLETLLQNHRIASLGEILAAVRERLDSVGNVVQASVTAARPLDAAAARDIQTALEARTRKSVRLSQSVDPALLAGFVVRVGSEVYDASLAQRLAKARRALHTATSD